MSKNNETNRFSSVDTLCGDRPEKEHEEILERYVASFERLLEEDPTVKAHLITATDVGVHEHIEWADDANHADDHDRLAVKAWETA